MYSTQENKSIRLKFKISDIHMSLSLKYGIHQPPQCCDWLKYSYIRAAKYAPI